MVICSLSSGGLPGLPLGQLVHLCSNEQIVVKTQGRRYSSAPFSARVYFPVASEVEFVTQQNFICENKHIRFACGMIRSPIKPAWSSAEFS
jgi:hypothetical protein